MQPNKQDDQTFYCSFCGKSQHEARTLVAGPAVFICEECICLCLDQTITEPANHSAQHETGLYMVEALAPVFQRTLKSISAEDIQRNPKLRHAIGTLHDACDTVFITT